LYPVEILRRFKAADPDNEGTIDAKELKAAAGRSITRLLKRPLALSWRNSGYFPLTQMRFANLHSQVNLARGSTSVRESVDPRVGAARAPRAATQQPRRRAA